MTDPGLELQGAIVAALKASAVAGGRIYDQVPQSTDFPYVSIGEMQVIDDDAEYVGGVEVYATLHVWSRAAGKPEAANIAAAVRGAIHEQDLRLPFWRLVEIRHQSTRLMTDPDGITAHGVMTFRALADPA